MLQYCFAKSYSLSCYSFLKLLAARRKLARLAVVVCLSVCLSVHLLQVGVLVLLKRLNVGSRKQRHAILVFWCQKSRQNSNGATPNGGVK